MPKPATLLGKGHCVVCGAPVQRGHVDASDRVETFQPADRGRWVHDPITGLMRRYGKDLVTNLTRYTVHTCPDDRAFD